MQQKSSPRHFRTNIQPTTWCQ